MKIFKLINEILNSKTIINSNKKDNEIIILIIKNEETKYK